MENNLITFDNRVFAFDVKRLFEILAEYCPSETTKERTKKEEWGYPIGEENSKAIKLIRKENSEHSVNDKETFSSVKYDLYKNLMQIILGPSVDEEGNIIQVTSLADLSFGQVLSFNTLLKDGIIIEITN